MTPRGRQMSTECGRGVSVAKAACRRLIGLHTGRRFIPAAPSLGKPGNLEPSPPFMQGPQGRVSLYIGTGSSWLLLAHLCCGLHAASFSLDSSRACIMPTVKSSSSEVMWHCVQNELLGMSLGESRRALPLPGQSGRPSQRRKHLFCTL